VATDFNSVLACKSTVSLAEQGQYLSAFCAREQAARAEEARHAAASDADFSKKMLEHARNKVLETRDQVRSATLLLLHGQVSLAHPQDMHTLCWKIWTTHPQNP
jgi:hypothetical protein